MDIGSLVALDTRGFLRKRFARLAPMYYMTIALGVIFGITLEHGNVRHCVHHGLARTILLLFGRTSWFSKYPFKAGILWTVSTMMFFYLPFPMLAP